MIDFDKKVEELKNVPFAEFLKQANGGSVRKTLVPGDLSAGWPSVHIRNEKICLTVPYFRSSRPDKSGAVQLYPLSYLITFLWPSGAPIEFKSLRFEKDYKAIDFSKPIGTFKHDALKDVPFEEYKAMRETLFGCYDELIRCVAERREFENIGKMRELFKVLMEPAQYPIYKHIAPKFFEAYCGL